MLSKIIKQKSFRKNLSLTLALSFLSGLLTYLSFPNATLDSPLDSWRQGVAFFSLVPLFWLWQTKTKVYQILSTIVFVITFYLLFLFWIRVFHPMALPIVIGYLVLIHLILLGVFRWMFRFFQKRKSSVFATLFLLPVLFTLFEYLRHVGFLKFPYGVIAYSQYQFLPFIQMVDITGIWGVSFFIYLTNAFITLVILFFWNKNKIENAKHSRTLFLAGGGIGLSFILFLIYGFCQINHRAKLESNDKSSNNLNNNLNNNEQTKHSNHSQKIKVGLVQPYLNFEQEYNSKSATEYFYTLTSLSWKIRRDNPKLVIWPETSIPYYYEYYLAKKLDQARKYQNYFKLYNNYSNSNSNNPHTPRSTQFLLGSIFYYSNAVYSPNDDESIVISNHTLRQSTRANSNKKISSKIKKENDLSSQAQWHYYNQALLLDEQGKSYKRYFKIYAVPFSEYFPFPWVFSFLPFLKTWLIEAGANQFSQGTMNSVKNKKYFFDIGILKNLTCPFHLFLSGL